MRRSGEEPWQWWKHGVIYQIYPRSFQDTDRNGIGDLKGIISRLDYLEWLGVDGVWLSPVYASPMVDMGYDITDYTSIDPIFGTMADMQALIAAAHQRGIRVIMDMVLNHTSDKHPWFLESASSMRNPRRNWYIWKSVPVGKRPNNWKSAMGGSAWTTDSTTGEMYLHSFFKEQPDLNWREPEVAHEFEGILRFWMELGVDGFRFDVINMVIKDRRFRNNPFSGQWPFFQEHRYNRDRGKSVEVVRFLRKTLDKFPERVGIGEVYASPPGNPVNAARYLSDGSDGLHLAFDFSLLFRRWNAWDYYQCINAWYQSIPQGGWPCIVLSNHDLLRHYNRIPWRTHKLAKARIAAVLLLTLRGTPFIYYGEEIGMRNTKVPRREIKDPMGHRFWPVFSGRDQARTPMQWSEEPNAGFSEVKSWLPVNRDFCRRNVRSETGDKQSLLNLYRNLILLRRACPALQFGSWMPVFNGRNGVLAWLRSYDGVLILVLLNFTNQYKQFTLTGNFTGRVMLSVQRGKGVSCSLQRMRVFPYEASVFRVSEIAETPH